MAAAAAAAAAALACGVGALSPVGLPGGASTVPQCGEDERPQRQRLDRGAVCGLQSSGFAECPDWCYSGFLSAEVQSFMVCDPAADSAPCCAQYVVDELTERVAYIRAMPYSVTGWNNVTGFCLDIKEDDRCPECADGFADEKELSCNSFDVPAYTAVQEGPGQCSASDDKSADPSPSAPVDDTDDTDDSDGDDSDDGGGVPVAGIAGGVAGGVAVGAAALTALLWWCCCPGCTGKRSSPRSSADSDDADGVVVAAAAARVRAAYGRGDVPWTDLGGVGSDRCAAQVSDGSADGGEATGSGAVDIAGAADAVNPGQYTAELAAEQREMSASSPSQWPLAPLPSTEY